MLRILAALSLLVPAAAMAQASNEGHSTMHHMPAGHAAMHGGSPAPGAASATPTQAGQAAFAAIQEIVQILENDPETDWSKVDIEGLRQHLVDMNNVTLAADVKSEPVTGGMRFLVTGEGPVRDSIRRMVAAHAAAMDGVADWHMSAADSDRGSTLTVLVPSRDLQKLQGLGFIGVMTRGMHHQQHHLMLARGQHPHG
ncbi:MAG: hypothetical protein P4M07_17765 [Xanthobacteraceae bacterium]|nr:hypothetical protein [Xanthobacteraceae bacterium]